MPGALIFDLKLNLAAKSRMYGRRGYMNADAQSCQRTLTFDACRQSGLRMKVDSFLGPGKNEFVRRQRISGFLRYFLMHKIVLG